MGILGIGEYDKKITLGKDSPRDVVVEDNVERALKTLVDNASSTYGNFGGEDGLIAVYMDKGYITPEQLKALIGDIADKDQNAKKIYEAVKAFKSIKDKYPNTEEAVWTVVFNILIQMTEGSIEEKAQGIIDYFEAESYIESGNLIKKSMLENIFSPGFTNGSYQAGWADIQVLLKTKYEQLFKSGKDLDSFIVKEFPSYTDGDDSLPVLREEYDVNKTILEKT